MRLEAAAPELRPSSVVLRGRYRLEELIGQGAVGAVYRGVDLLTDRPVAVKRMKVGAGTDADEERTFERATIANEFRTLSGLRHPNVVSVLDYGFDEDGWPLVVMELVAGARNLMDATESLSEAERVELVVQLLGAVEYLRRHGVVHRDIKPSNVLVQNGRVKLVDFGISLDTTIRGRIDDALGGTYAYIAPELFRGEPVTSACDVYSVGVAAYEVIARRHPHGTAQSLIAALRPGAPQPPWCAEAPVGDAVARMMAQTPSDRPTPQMASQLITGRSSRSSRPPPNVVSSYLRAARFVNREEELRTLERALGAVDRGEPSSWLLRGASGAGKSRFMTELRTRALVAEFDVVDAQCTQEVRAPYAPWRTLLRQLALLVPGSLADEVERLDAHPISGGAVEWQDEGVRDGIRAGMLTTVRRLLGSLERKMLVLLDDVQWIDEESLWVLEQILPLSGVRAMFCGACRMEESRLLHVRLSGCRQIPIGALESDHVAELADSMLGTPAQEPLVRHLVRETGGNPFFIVESIHTIGDRMDTLARLALEEPSLIPRQLRGVLAQRLTALDEPTRHVLNVAAVHGRTIDVPLLAALFDDQAVESALHVATDVAIIAPERDTWQFCHDQMRAAFLDGLSPDAKARIHLDLGNALAARSRGEPGIAAELARHFGGAGRVGDEARYALVAGREAFALGAYDQAVEWLTRVLEIGSSTDLERARTRRELAEALIGAGRMEEARGHLNFGAGLLAPRARFGRTRARDASVTAKERAYELSRIYERLAHTRFFDNDVFGVFDASLREYWHAHRARAAAELARASANLAGCFELGVTNPVAVALRRRAHRLVELAGDTGAEGWVLQIDGVAAAGKGELLRAEDCLGRAEALWKRTGNERRRQEARTLLGMVLFHAGRAEESLALRSDTYEVGVRAGNRQAQAWGLLGLAEHHLRWGDARAASEYVRRAIALGDAVGRAERAWAAGLSAHLSALLEDEQLAIENVKEALQVVGGTLPTAFYALEGYSGIVSALHLLADGADAALVRIALRQLVIFAAAFPIGRPRLLYHLGLFFGNLTSMRQNALFRLSERAALRLGLTYDAELAQHRSRGLQHAGD